MSAYLDVCVCVSVYHIVASLLIIKPKSNTTLTGLRCKSNMIEGM